MASLPNSKTLSLSFVLLLFMHVHGSNARDVKVEQEVPEKKEVSKEDDSYARTYSAAYSSRKHIHPSESFSKDDSYARTYNAAYSSRKHIHPSPSFSKDDSYARTYNAAYSSRKHIHSSQQEATHHDSNQYLTGYIHSQKDQKKVGKSYTGAYGDGKRENQHYITQYGDGKRENQPYITQYGDGKKDNQPYITQYGNGKRLNRPYITGYIHSKRENQPYITQYGDGKRESQPYITGYIHSKKENQPYITQYGDGKRENQPYITNYIHGKKDSKVSTQDSKDSYSASYKTTEQDSYAATYRKDSKDSYAATYGKDSKDSDTAFTYGKDSKDSYTTAYGKNKVDHTEAFKTGFFTLDDLYVGNRMTLKFPIPDFPDFLTKKEADSIPFSTPQLPSVFPLFSINEDSPQAQAMRDTLDQCELQPLTGETKTCVSSLESMIDFVRSIIGPEPQLDILTTTLPTPSSIPLQNFTILEISPDVDAPKWVACHPLPYPYKVFYCHFIGTGSKIFKVQLGSENGEQVSALGICHLDTSEWSADHILFKQLGMKPGDAPVCHFFPVKHLMWVPLPTKATM